MPTILIVDDEPMIRLLCERALERDDRQLLLAETPAEAARLVEQAGELDLALVDKNLEHASGLDVVRDLQGGYPDAEYVIMTAYASLDSAVEAVRLRLYDYVTKPFEIDAVEALVDRALEKARSNRESAREHAAAVNYARDAASRDPLTALPNRETFVAEVDAALRRAQLDPSQGFAVLVIDLNDFGRINDSLGHTIGDELLKLWVARVSHLMRGRDLLGRIGADQFTILMQAIDDPSEAISMVERVNHALALPFQLDEHRVAVSVSVGISLSAEGYERGEDMLRDAGTALVHAKARGKGTHTVFVTEMHSRALETLTLHQSLRRAVDESEFVSHYQPVVALESGRIVGFEALARWQDPTRGLLSPANFLTGAVEGGFIAEISWQILCVALEQHKRWLTMVGDGGGGLSMNINVAPPLLLRRRFVQDLERLLEVLDLSPARLKIEVTEVVALDNTAVSAEVIQSLRRNGIAVCLDDFGTGYASLSWLHEFPVDEIKIDKSFVAQMTIDRRSQILVGAAINLAHSLGLTVVAEGIETREQLEELVAMDCEYGQGYLFARPVAAEQAEELLRQGTLSADELQQ